MRIDETKLAINTFWISKAVWPRRLLQWYLLGTPRKSTAKLRGKFMNCLCYHLSVLCIRFIHFMWISEISGFFFRWICIYPAYLNSKKTLAEGRKLSKAYCVENPTHQEIRDVLVATGLHVGVENKLYPRERSKVWYPLYHKKYVIFCHHLNNTRRSK